MCQRKVLRDHQGSFSFFQCFSSGLLIELWKNSCGPDMSPGVTDQVCARMDSVTVVARPRIDFLDFQTYLNFRMLKY